MVFMILIRPGLGQAGAPPVVCPDGTVLPVGVSSASCPGGAPNDVQQQLADLWSSITTPTVITTAAPSTGIPTSTLLWVGGGMLIFAVLLGAMRR